MKATPGCDEPVRPSTDAPAGDEAGPFAGVRVVEFGQFVSVPYCAQLLADGGAEVIKVEAPAGDPSRHFQQVAPGETRIFLARNRGKRSLPIRLRSPEARAVLDALIGWADVVLTNFRPGVGAALGLDARALQARAPELVIGNVTAFGTRGPDAELAGMDIVVQARSGLMAANGRTIEGRPAAGDPVSADYMCATQLAFGVAAALLRRERTGRGGIVEVSLMHAAMALANNQLSRVEAGDGPAHRAALAELERLRREGADYESQRASLPAGRPSGMTKVYFRTYQSADLPLAVACGSGKLRRALLAVLELDDEALDADDTWGPRWEDHYDLLKARAEARFRSRPGGQWLAALRAAGVPAAAVKLPLELFEDEQALANGMLRDIEHAVLGPVRVVGPPVSLNGGGFAGEGFRPGPPAAPLGSESEGILADLGLEREVIARLRARGVVG